MGSLGSSNGVPFLFRWILKPHLPEPAPRADSVGCWNAIAASSKYGLGLFAAGARWHLLDILSCASGFHEPSKNVQRRNSIRHGPSSERHYASWLHHSPPIRSSGIGSHTNWRIGILFSRSWSGWFTAGTRNNNRGNVIGTALGGDKDGSLSESTDRSYPSRTVTNIIIGLNALVFMGQIATNGRLLLWGAKVNDLIAQGQFWRLLTPSVLHANIFHLLVNGYSLNSIGPTVESLSGPKRFLAVYAISAVASTTFSYYYCAAPSVGASGAIFGLVGALAVFLVRHKNMMVGGQRSLQQVARVIAVNMVLGLVSGGIDNWSHFGGLIGGAAITWLLGPLYTFEMPPGGGKRLLVDRPPISYLLPSQASRK